MKRMLALILTAVMLITCTTAFPASAAARDNVEPGSIGDPNGDGKINLFDCATALQYIAGWELGDNYIPEAADINRDGVINLTDVAMNMRLVTGWYDKNDGGLIVEATWE